MNKKYYLQVGLICRKALTGCFSTIAHLSHSSHSTQDFFTIYGITQVHQHPYSPDEQLPVTSGCPEIKKNTYKGNGFDDVKDIKQNGTRQLLGILKAEFQPPLCLRRQQQLLLISFFFLATISPIVSIVN